MAVVEKYSSFNVILWIVIISISIDDSPPHWCPLDSGSSWPMGINISIRFQNVGMLVCIWPAGKKYYFHKNIQWAKNIFRLLVTTVGKEDDLGMACTTRMWTKYFPLHLEHANREDGGRCVS